MNILRITVKKLAVLIVLLEQLNTETNSNETKKQEFTSYFKLGYMASLGVTFSFGNHVSLFVETNARVSSFEVKHGTITEWNSSNSSNGSSNSTNHLEGMDRIDKETDYLKEYSVHTDSDNPSSPPDKDSPKKDVSFSLPSSSIGLAAGLIIKF